jgi:hypothetical protein
MGAVWQAVTDTQTININIQPVYRIMLLLIFFYPESHAKRHRLCRVRQTTSPSHPALPDIYSSAEKETDP